MTSMNIFRLSGDLLHLLSILIILLKIYTQKSCAGISLKSQILYAVVFSTRYIDIFFNFENLYNWVMKLIFLASAYTILWLMIKQPPINHTYSKFADTFPAFQYLIPPACVLALIFHETTTLFEIVWTFSVFLEAVAILPQIVVLQNMSKNTHDHAIEPLTADYVATLGLYRLFYLINWIYRYSTEEHYWHPIVWFAGTVQTLLYCDFFYYYAISKLQGRKIVLPV